MSTGGVEVIGYSQRLNQIGATCLEYGKYAVDTAISWGKAGYSASLPYLQALISKVNELWIAAQPHLLQFLQFVQSPMGSACVLFIGAYVVLRLSQYIGDGIMKDILTIAGIALAAIGGIRFLATGYLPPSLFTIQRIS